jgi:hypothetical protein
LYEIAREHPALAYNALRHHETSGRSVERCTRELRKAEVTSHAPAFGSRAGRVTTRRGATFALAKFARYA